MESTGCRQVQLKEQCYSAVKLWKFCVQNGAFWGKIALCFDYKQTAILTQTFGHKWFDKTE